MATSSQKLAVVLAFVAGALSLAAAAIEYSRTGHVKVTLLGGGLLMIALGLGGLGRLRQP
jgi:hypothetical protein